MKWTTKALIQRVLSSTPAGERIYYLGQKYAGGFRNFTIEDRVQQGVSLLKCLFEVGEDIEGRRTVEIGTGWTPIIPLLFWACGQWECDTYDITRLLKLSLVIETARQFAALAEREDVHLDTGRRAEFESRVRSLHQSACDQADGYAILRNCNIRYHAPADASSTNLPDASVDLVYSNNVLEHVPREAVHRLFAEAYRILRPGGYMLHLIDPSDHFSHSDPSISAINFLQFSEEAFSKYNSRFIFQNRLRASTWYQIVQDHNFQISYWRTSIDEKAVQQLPSLKLDRAFSSMSAEDICSTAVWVVAKRTS